MSLSLFKRICLRILNWTSFAVLVPAAVLVIASLVPIPGGFKVYTVLTGSMEPAVPTGALILTRTGILAEKISVGEIATFKSPRSDDVLITHRIAEVIGEGEGRRFITRGDANGSVDPWEVRAGNVVGLYQKHVPYVGYALEFAKSPIGLLLLVILPTALIVASELREIVQVLVESKLNQVATACGYVDFTAMAQSLRRRKSRLVRRAWRGNSVPSTYVLPARSTTAASTVARKDARRCLDSALPRPTARGVEPLRVVAPVRRRYFMTVAASSLLLFLVAPVLTLLVSNTVVLGSNTVVTATAPLSGVPEECSGIAFDGEPLVGDDNSEVLEGTEGNDLIFGNGGSDKLVGLGGDDCLVGGEGSDSLLGGDGDDVLLGGPGSDSLRGGDGDDKLYGGEDSDSLYGGDGNDELVGGTGEDSAHGEQGTDMCEAESKKTCEP